MLTRLRALARRLRSAFGKGRIDREFSAELESHLDLLTEENLGRGFAPAEARRRALIRLGGPTQLKEIHRELNSFPGLDSLLQEFRYAARGLGKNPGFTAVAVLTLALGIGINATMFSMVSAILLRRPPVQAPDRVAVVSSVNPNPVFHADASLVSAANFLAWQKSNSVFSEIAALDPFRNASLTGQGQPETVRAAAVTPNYFAVLGVAPQIGRAFTELEARPGEDRVVLLSHPLWERRFGSDPGIAGRRIRLNREEYVVIGVMPRGFQLLGYTPQLWTPLLLQQADSSPAARASRFLQLFGRLRPGVAVKQAEAEFALLARQAEAGFPQIEKGWGVRVRSLPDFLVYDFGIESGLAVLMTTVGFVLLIACANVAGLLLARAAGRKKELGIRFSLGASRLWIVRQLLAEGLLIALLGGGTGLLLAVWGIDLFRAHLNFNEAISTVQVRLDWNVAGFTFGVSLLSAVLCSLAPALAASGSNVQAGLQEESRTSSGGRSQGRIRRFLVIGEVAAALFLLIGAGLLFRAIFLLEHQPLGFRTDHLLTADLTLDRARYRDASGQRAFAQELIDRLAENPGAESAAAASDLPATGADSFTLEVKGQPELPGNRKLSALDVVVTASYFRAAGIRILEGRSFTERDREDAPPVLVVNQEFVHRNLQDREAVGKQVRLDLPDSPPGWYEIVGVASNLKSYSEDARVDPQVYESFLQRPLSSFSLMVRTRSEPDLFASELRKSVAGLDPELPLGHVMSMSALLDRQKGGNPFFTRVLGSFAILALLLASIGIYGLIDYSVKQRRREVGIRMALGAGPSQVVGLVCKEGIRMTGIGVGIGWAMALPLPRAFDAIFFGVHFREPLFYVFVPILLLLVGALATLLPARRAAGMDPLVALHYE